MAHGRPWTGSARTVLAAEAAYFVATGVAPFVSRGAFERVTGRKREWWLVQTVGALVTAVGGSALVALRRDRVTPELVGVLAGSAAALAAIDVVYALRGRIAPIYLVDAGLHVAALAVLAADRPSAGGLSRPRTGMGGA